MEYKKVLKLCPYFQSTEICYFCDIHLWFSRYSWDFEPVWKWFFWWTELWLFCVAPQPVNCCCVQCDCCGFYGGDNKYIGCVLCTCRSLSRVMIIQWWYSVCVPLNISDLIHSGWLQTQRFSIYKDVCFDFTLSFKFLLNDTCKELFVKGHSIFDMVEQWQPLVAREKHVVQADSLSVHLLQWCIKILFYQYENKQLPQSLKVHYLNILL